MEAFTEEILKTIRQMDTVNFQLSKYSIRGIGKMTCRMERQEKFIALHHSTKAILPMESKKAMEYTSGI